MATIRRTREEWISLLKDMDASGMTQLEWCEANGINYDTMKEIRSRVAKGLPKTKKDPISKKAGWIKLAEKYPEDHKSSIQENTLEIRFGSVTITVSQ